MNAIDILKQQGMTNDEAAKHLEGTKQGLRDIHEGRVKPLSEVKRDLALMPENCHKLDTCPKIVAILDKDKLDYTAVVKACCEKCKEKEDEL